MVTSRSRRRTPCATAAGPGSAGPLPPMRSMRSIPFRRQDPWRVWPADECRAKPDRSPFRCGIQPFENQDQGDGESDDRPLHPVEAEPRADDAGEDSKGRVNTRVAPRAQQGSDADEREIKGADDPHRFHGRPPVRIGSAHDGRRILAETAPMMKLMVHQSLNYSPTAVRLPG